MKEEEDRRRRREKCNERSLTLSSSMTSAVQLQGKERYRA